MRVDDPSSALPNYEPDRGVGVARHGPTDWTAQSRRVMDILEEIYRMSPSEQRKYAGVLNDLRRRARAYAAYAQLPTPPRLSGSHSLPSKASPIASPWWSRGREE